MSVSLIIPWRGRVQIARTIRKFIEETDGIGGEVVLVNFGGSDEELLGHLGRHEPKVGVVNVRCADYFSKPRAMNIGASAARHDVLFFCDCDVILDDDVVVGLLAAVRSNSDAFATMQYVVESEQSGDRTGHISRFEYSVKIVTRGGRQVCIENHDEDMLPGQRKAPGLLCVRRQHFLDIQGYNSRRSGWGWEDQDMICRLTLGLGLRRVCIGRGVHITHGDKERLSAYEETDKWQSRDRAFRSCLAEYDAGEFLGTFATDVAEARASTDVKSPRRKPLE